MNRIKNNIKATNTEDIFAFVKTPRKSPMANRPNTISKAKYWFMFFPPLTFLSFLFSIFYFLFFSTGGHAGGKDSGAACDAGFTP